MISTVTAAVLQDYTLQAASAAGYVGEHNAELLEIALGPYLTDGFTTFYLHFDTAAFGGRLTSNAATQAGDAPAYLKDGKLCCPLTEALTATGRLRVQVEGQKTENGAVVIKKTSIAALFFHPSVMSAGALPALGVPDRLAQLEAKIDALAENAPASAQIAALETAVETLRAAVNGGAQAEAVQALASRVAALENASAAAALEPASETTLGGVKVAANRAVTADAGHTLAFNEYNVNYDVLKILLISTLMVDSDIMLLVDHGSGEAETADLQDTFQMLSLDVVQGIYRAVLVISAGSAPYTYYDEEIEEHTLTLNPNLLYIFRMVDGRAKFEIYDAGRLRNLLLQGV